MDKTVRFDVVSNLTVLFTITTNKKKKGENEICEKVNF